MTLDILQELHPRISFINAVFNAFFLARYIFNARRPPLKGSRGGKAVY